MTIFCKDISEVKFEKETPELENNVIHIWCVDTISSDKKINSLKKALSDDENLRAARFVFEKDRNQFITAHGALRTILSTYLGAAPEKINFRRTSSRKPFITSPHTSLKFNISHSENKILIAIANHEVGVDVEKIKKGFEYKDLVKTYFSAREQKAIVESKKPENTFYKFWTRKEAFLKSSGVGITDKLKDIEVNKEENVINNIKGVCTVQSFQLKDDFYASIAAAKSQYIIKFFEY